MKNQKVSVVIPAYNAERTIKTCLNAIFNTSFPKENLEVIVVDNNSSDETLRICESFPCRLIKEKTQGRSYARNKGIKESSGEFIAFLDADTHIEIDWFEKMLATFNDSCIGGVQGPVIPSFLDGREGLNNFRYRSISEGTAHRFNILELIIRESPMINSAACMYRREVFEYVTGFDTHLERHEDIDLSRRVCLSGYDLSISKDAVCHVIYHGDSWHDYYMRSFWDGFYKNDYLSKWSHEINFINREKKTESDRILVTSYGIDIKKEPKPRQINHNVYIIQPLLGIISFFLKWILERDNYWFCRAIVDVMKMFGRLCGIIRKWKGDSVEILINNSEKLVKTFNSTLIEGSEQGSSPLYKIPSNIRFIRDGYSFYIFDINKNEAYSINQERSMAIIFIKVKILCQPVDEILKSEYFFLDMAYKGLIETCEK